MSTWAIDVENVQHRYGQRLALNGLSVQIPAGEMFAFLGPNGGGKTTLFRLLSTLIPLQSGSIKVFEYPLPAEQPQVRESLGVVFQAPSLDRHLTVYENLVFQGNLYGYFGKSLKKRIDELLDLLKIEDRRADLVQELSGGLRRRVEIAKSLLHSPRLLLLDEPSNGLDPRIRSQLWEALLTLKEEHDVTIVITTHLLEEADKVDQLAILHQGKIIEQGSPETLQQQIGGESIYLTADQPQALADAIQQVFSWPVSILDHQVRVQPPEAAQQIVPLMERFSDTIQSLTLGKPTLEDVFINATGQRLSDDTRDESFSLEKEAEVENAH
ncbi:Daunorubicin resistance ABC transporter ATPase subunit [Planctomycetales bacterium 10988]|nr:Daunorubicin resistance ABC transporter ATPase subunit [Planctomycetales bacterium 10988]